MSRSCKRPQPARTASARPAVYPAANQVPSLNVALSQGLYGTVASLGQPTTPSREFSAYT